MATRSTIPVLAVLAALSVLLPPAANAGAGNPISKAFQGQILLSDYALPAPNLKDSKGTIESYRKQSLQVITSDVANDVASWAFHFTAFLEDKPRTSRLALEFYTDDKEKLFVAEKRLRGADPNLQILASMVRISEDDNLNRGRKYLLKLVAKQDAKDVVLATTKFATK